MTVLSRYITGLCVLMAASPVYAEKSTTTTLSFSGKGNGPIQVTDDSGSTEAITSRPITVIPTRKPEIQQSGKAPVNRASSKPKSKEDKSIDIMLKQRPHRDPRRLNTAVTPAPPKSRK